ncbi:LCP family protein [bacterium]|nr:LCP family protein [bacterium]
MHDKRINLIDRVYTPPRFKEAHVARDAKRKKVWRNFKILLFLLIFLSIFFSQVIVSQNSFLGNLGKLSFWEGVVKMAIGKDKMLKGELSDRINVLILGMGGAQHEGPYLTDSIILASIKPSSHQIALLSIPRDLYVPIPKYGWQRINFANALGAARSKDGGELASKVVSNILSLPVHYWVRADFQIFKELVDKLGGLEIEVEKGFIDYQFPGLDYQFRTVSFDAGLQTMDGDRTLEFVRSRHGDNGENSDFSRSKRQQKVLIAIANKILDQDILSKPQKILSFYNIFQNNISSNLDISQMIKMARLANYIPLENIITQVIEIGPEGLLEQVIMDNGAYVLKTKTGNFKELAELARNIFSTETVLEIQQPLGNPIPK